MKFKIGDRVRYTGHVIDNCSVIGTIKGRVIGSQYPRWDVLWDDGSVLNALESNLELLEQPVIERFTTGERVFFHNPEANIKQFVTIVKKHEFPARWVVRFKDGREDYVHEEHLSIADVPKMTGWINIYRLELSYLPGTTVWPTKEEAIRGALQSPVATIQIEFEVEG